MILRWLDSGCGRTLWNTCLFAGQPTLLGTLQLVRLTLGQTAVDSPVSLQSGFTSTRLNWQMDAKDKMFFQTKEQMWRDGAWSIFLIVIVTQSVSILLQIFFEESFCECQIKSYFYFFFIIFLGLKKVAVKAAEIKLVCYSFEHFL